MSKNYFILYTFLEGTLELFFGIFTRIERGTSGIKYNKKLDKLLFAVHFTHGFSKIKYSNHVNSDLICAES